MSLSFVLLAQVSVIAYALVGGVFLAFSDFIMRSLARAETPGGIEVMQNINREVFRYVFMPLFLGMAAVSLIIIVYAYFALHGPAALFMMIAASVYLAGVFGVTVVFNVPLNKRLEGLDHPSAEASEFWTGSYLPNWTYWNSVRTVGCMLASTMQMLALTWVGAA